MLRPCNPRVTRQRPSRAVLPMRLILLDRPTDKVLHPPGTKPGDNLAHAFSMPIFAPSFSVEIGHSSPAPAADQMTQVLDSKRGRNY